MPFRNHCGHPRQKDVRVSRCRLARRLLYGHVPFKRRLCAARRGPDLITGMPAGLDRSCCKGPDRKDGLRFEKRLRRRALARFKGSHRPYDCAVANAVTGCKARSLRCCCQVRLATRQRRFDFTSGCANWAAIRSTSLSGRCTAMGADAGPITTAASGVSSRGGPYSIVSAVNIRSE